MNMNHNQFTYAVYKAIRDGEETSAEGLFRKFRKEPYMSRLFKGSTVNDQQARQRGLYSTLLQNYEDAKEQGPILLEMFRINFELTGLAGDLQEMLAHIETSNPEVVREVAANYGHVAKNPNETTILNAIECLEEKGIDASDVRARWEALYPKEDDEDLDNESWDTAPAEGPEDADD